MQNSNILPLGLIVSTFIVAYTDQGAYDSCSPFIYSLSRQLRHINWRNEIQSRRSKLMRDTLRMTPSFILTNGKLILIRSMQCSDAMKNMKLYLLEANCRRSLDSVA